MFTYLSCHYYYHTNDRLIAAAFNTDRYEQLSKSTTHDLKDFSVYKTNININICKLYNTSKDNIRMYYA